MSRGMIKWQPMNTACPSSIIINQALKNKNIIEKPNLYEEQINNIQEKIKEAWQTGQKIQIKYYKNGQIYSLIGQITSIITKDQQIIINHQKHIFFSQITEIK